MRFGTKQSQRCFLVQGLFSALSVMLGQTASHLILAILTADTTRRATRYCSRTPMLTERAASPVAGSGLLRRGCTRPHRLLNARSHVDSHDLSAESESESATAGQSVRRTRIQAPTGHSARWHQTVSEVFSTAHVVQGLSALSVMLHTTRRATRCCSHTPMLTERAASPWVCAPLCAHVDCVQLADMQLDDVQLADMQ